MTTDYLRRSFRWNDEGLGLLGHEPARMPDDLRQAETVPAAALLAHCRWLCQRALTDTIPRYEQDLAAGRLGAANGLFMKLVEVHGYIRGVSVALNLFNDEPSRARWAAANGGESDGDRGPE